MTHISYHAASLEDIAKMFDKHAATANSNQAGAITIRQGARYAGEAYAWHTAAEILRQTKIG